MAGTQKVMNESLPQIIALATLLPAFLFIYLSVVIQRLNSVQVERLFGLEEDEERYRGFRINLLFISLHFAAIFLEIICFMSFFRWLVADRWSNGSIVFFLLVAVAIENCARIVFPAIFPFHMREGLGDWQKRVLLFFGYLFLPAAWITDRIIGYLSRVFHPKNQHDRIAQAEETIRSIIDAGEKDGVFLSSEGEMLQSIVDLSETTVREVMTPRIDLQAIDISSSIDDLIAKVVESGYSKIPVYKNRIDDIVGILYAKDVLQFWQSNGTDITLDSLMRNATFVPETKRINILLKEFQKDKKHLTIVVDEFGGVAGLVTIEDLLEEIVGEIHDEYDHEEETMRIISENVWEVAARIDLDELSESIKVIFPDDNYETLGGFLFHLFGRIPTPGESHQYLNLSFKILEANERRIETVLVSKTDEKQSSKTEKVVENDD
ncbi:hemolysin family protein [bacterium]|nr:hemolysin family protein [bacterium]